MIHEETRRPKDHEFNLANQFAKSKNMKLGSIGVNANNGNIYVQLQNPKGLDLSFTLDKSGKEHQKESVIGASKSLKKASVAYHDAVLKYQELQKSFVAQSNPAKRQSMKASLIAAHKDMKSAELEFNKAIANEPDSDDFDALVDHKISDNKLKESIKGYIRTAIKEGVSPNKSIIRMFMNDVGKLSDKTYISLEDGIVKITNDFQSPEYEQYKRKIAQLISSKYKGKIISKKDPFESGDFYFKAI